MDAIVGGQAVRKQINAADRKGKSVDPKQATHGREQEGPSAMELGQKVMQKGKLDSSDALNAGLPGKRVVSIFCKGSALAIGKSLHPFCTHLDSLLERSNALCDQTHPHPSFHGNLIHKLLHYTNLFLDPVMWLSYIVANLLL